MQHSWTLLNENGPTHGRRVLAYWLIIPPYFWAPPFIFLFLGRTSDAERPFMVYVVRIWSTSHALLGQINDGTLAFVKSIHGDGIPLETFPHAGRNTARCCHRLAYPISGALRASAYRVTW
jgi:hypothetical protein